jgi:hypothetical protein
MAKQIIVVDQQSATAMAAAAAIGNLVNGGRISGLPANFNITDAIKVECRNMQIQADPNSSPATKKQAAEFSVGVALNMLEGLDNPIADQIRQEIGGGGNDIVVR